MNKLNWFGCVYILSKNACVRFSCNEKEGALNNLSVSMVFSNAPTNEYRLRCHTPSGSSQRFPSDKIKPRKTPASKNTASATFLTPH